MKLLQDKIINEGQVLSGDVLKVDGFLNQQLDMDLYAKMSQEISAHFSAKNVTKILTVEASGIALAATVALAMHNLPVIFAKKHSTSNRDADFYCTPIFSFTHNKSYNVTIAKRFLTKDDRILIVDDFLARGEAVRGLINLVSQAGATTAGVAIAVEKGYQGGGDQLRAEGIDLYSLAIVDKMDENAITFRP